MNYPPCRNPNCKSFGKPHPNCKCYDGMAEGGEVGPYCASSKAHQSDCEYFAEGGDVSPDFIPDDQFVPQAEEQSPAPSPEGPTDQAATPPPVDDSPDFISDEDFVPAQSDKTDSPDFISDEDFVAAEPVDPETKSSGYSLPTSLSDAARRLGSNGLLQEAPPVMDGHKITDEEFKEGRDKQEKAAMWGSLVTGGGVVGAAGKAAEAAAKFANLSKAGSWIVKGAISNGLIQGSDEVSKWMLGEGDPNDPVGAALAHVGAATAIGGAFGAGGAAVESAAAKAAASKVGQKLQSYLAGIASASENSGGVRDIVDSAVKAHIESSGGSLAAYKAGQKAADEGLGKAVAGAIPKVGAFLGAKTHFGAEAGYVGGKVISGKIGNYVNSLVAPSARKYATPVILKILASGNTSGIIEALGHADDVAKGFNMVSKSVDALFKGSTNAAVNNLTTERDRKKLDKYIGDGGVDQDIQQETYDQNAVPQGFAEGGEVAPEAEPHGVATHYPEQHMLMSAAKGRVSNYLRGLKPHENHPKLAFDDAPDTSDHKKAYHKALDVANRPLSVLDDIKDGTIEPENVKHFVAMFPEINGLLHKQIAKKIVDAQLKGEKPSYKVRQGLSMFMGTALSGEMTPENIQAAQAVFRAPSKQNDEHGKGQEKKPPANLSKSSRSYLTDDQARMERQQKV